MRNLIKKRINQSIDAKKIESSRSQKLDNIKDCSECQVRFLCSGGCFSEKILSGQKITDKLKDDSCNLIKLEWSKIILLYAQIKDKDHV